MRPFFIQPPMQKGTKTMAQQVKLAKRFNPRKPYGECHGDPMFAYEQNGVVYNASFHAVNATGKPIPMEEGPAIEAEPEVPQLNKPKQRDIDPDDETEDEKPIDLVAWRDNKLPGILWPLLVAAVKAQLGRAPSSKIEALEMINKKWPPPDVEPEASAPEA